MSNDNVNEPSPSGQLARYVTSIVMVIAVAAFFVPVLVFVAVPLLGVAAIWHTLMMARAQGSIIPFAILLGADILLIVVLLGMNFVE